MSLCWSLAANQRPGDCSLLRGAQVVDTTLLDHGIGEVLLMSTMPQNVFKGAQQGALFASRLAANPQTVLNMARGRFGF
jgi:hypothetical protein